MDIQYLDPVVMIFDGVHLICFLILLDALDTLDERLTSFFKKCIQPNVKSEWKEEQFDKIKQVR